VSVSLRIALAVVVAAVAGAAPVQAAPPAPTGLAVADLVSDPGVFDPQLSWTAVAGAKGYEIEINPTDTWASGSAVCCKNISSTNPVTTVGTSFSPPTVLPNDDEYYWRVRAIDASNNAGPWTAGNPFSKSYGSTPSVPDVRLADANLDAIAAGSTVATPIVLWDPSPGASSYRVHVTTYDSGASVCDWSTSVLGTKTTVTGWTPLGWSKHPDADPLQRGIPASTDLTNALTAGQAYCVRVSPIDGPAVASGGPQVEANWTYLPSIAAPAFTWAGPPSAGSCAPCVPQASDYLRPVAGSTIDTMPVFTWNPVPGAQSYFVVVADDPQFTNIEDYAYTRVAAYAPRELAKTRGYPDKTSNYYWAVLPAESANGLDVFTDVTSANPQAFKKQTTAPTLLGPTGGAVVSTTATVFHWTPVDGARRYHLQISDDQTFANVVKETPIMGQATVTSGAATDSTAYTSSTAYPTGTTLYWRVQAELEDENSSFVGLRWSATGTFQRTASGGPGGGSGPANTLFKLTGSGYPVKGKTRTVTITVKSRATNAPVAQASVRVSGAGVKAATKKTGVLGKVSFRVRATRYPGTVSFKVSKAGFTTATIKRVVRYR
jgi:hypothetical protein